MALGDHVGIDVGGQDTHIQLGRFGQGLKHGQGHRIGLLPVRAGRRPQTDPAAGAGARRKFRHDPVAQVVEMVRLAIEAGDVGGQGRRHLLTLVHAVHALDQGAVVAEAGQTQGAQALGQARIHERGLALVQGDARVGVQHLGDVAEILGGEDELALDDGSPAGGGGHAASASTCGRM